MWLGATELDRADLRNLSELDQTHGSGLLSKNLKRHTGIGCFAQGSIENLEDKLSTSSLGSKTVCSSNKRMWPFQHYPTPRSPDCLLSYSTRATESEQTTPATTALRQRLHQHQQGAG